MLGTTPLETPCREWQGVRNTKGYAPLRRRGRNWLVHRWVWTLMYGPIPDGMKVLHRCDNPPCFRLDHLFLGTNKDNSMDMVAKGRSLLGTHKTHCPQSHPYSGDNLYIRPDGIHGCRACIADASLRYRERRRNQP